ncbi:BON domain-containing protein [Pelomonas sp. CA6]|uniref:BON domain-containing protein n=1 Tax=Pelomonas sp. CA6 TaxID=2907999 RepID=UPI001F4C2245|nr:BON domain-containing protein [Pelomonas sp. CA6]MCH7344605.1 BON domain-containing protein [Pelomonas sp. CA6]
MHTPKTPALLSTLVVALASLSAAPVMAANPQEPQPQQPQAQQGAAAVDDATLATLLKTKIAADPTVSAMAINVEISQGVVQLNGVAKNAEERTRVEQLARSVSGVKDVRNNIEVRG